MLNKINILFFIKVKFNWLIWEGPGILKLILAVHLPIKGNYQILLLINISIIESIISIRKSLQESLKKREIHSKMECAKDRVPLTVTRSIMTTQVLSSWMKYLEVKAGRRVEDWMKVTDRFGVMINQETLKIRLWKTSTMMMIYRIRQKDQN